MKTVDAKLKPNFKYLFNYTQKFNINIFTSAETFLPLTPAATKAKYWITFFVFSVLPAPDSPLDMKLRIIYNYI